MALSILYWANYVEGLTKIKRKSEAAVESQRVLRFTFDELRVITANVQASMRDTSYKVQIFLESEDNGVVESSSCECPMGRYKCHHVAAALLYGYKKASKTDVKCSWIKHPKSAQPKVTTTMEELFPPKQPGYRGKLTMSPEKVIQTAWITIGQRENIMWAKVRKLRFTASNFGQIVTAIRKNRLNVSLKKRLLSAYNLEKRAPIQWGLAHEKTAIQEYCKLFEVNVLETGIWLHESGVLGASPDGFVQGSPKDITERVHQQENKSTLVSPDIVEVKCPFSARSMTIKEACSNVKDFFLDCNPSDSSLHLRTKHDYWHQIQGQLYLTGTQCCDLVVWTQTDIQVVRIEKDVSWSPNISSMIEFYYKVFLPSL
ncbi:uncharacterized protein LOC133183939 [Saccostrea echinata]|uniref:uncharacterized protein LOC133183939 n=1 Tax=Saccostrea echinata TaxID=191078 RepID=UPI002A830334|nr:uncharacterized protein LOC133183939 [Saccostrea echinata]